MLGRRLSAALPRCSASLGTVYIVALHIVFAASFLAVDGLLLKDEGVNFELLRNPGGSRLCATDNELAAAST